MKSLEMENDFRDTMWAVLQVLLICLIDLKGKFKNLPSASHHFGFPFMYSPGNIFSNGRNGGSKNWGD